MNSRTAVLAALVLGIGGWAPARSGSGTFELTGQALSAGQQQASSASFAMTTSLGPPEAGTTMASASFSLRGGFPAAASLPPADEQIFFDGFES